MRKTGDVRCCGVGRSARAVDTRGKWEEAAKRGREMYDAMPNDRDLD